MDHVKAIAVGTVIMVPCAMICIAALYWPVILIVPSGIFVAWAVGYIVINLWRERRK